MSTQEEVVVRTDEVTDSEKKKTRSFKVKLTQTDPAYGRYNGDSPYQAANKALSEIVRNFIKEGGDANAEHVFWLIESTKISKKRVHQYRGRRCQLDEPVVYSIGDSPITKYHKNELKKIKKSEQEELQPRVTKKTAKVAAAKAAKSAKKAAKSAKTTKKVATAKSTKKVATAKTTKATKKVATTKATKKVATTKTTKAAPKAAKTTKVAAPKAAKATKKVAAAK